ncbi:MAG: RHS repeat protein, partial [Sandaracinaceae bacterium]|nr:RHS repeat protein [Sandaracinaceae bacterium]
PSVVWQEVTDGATIPADSGTDAEHVVPVRGLGAITVRSTVDIVDNRGHVLRSSAHGRPGIDARIESNAVVHHVPGRWIFRQGQSHVRSSDFYPQVLRNTEPTYNANGDLIHSRVYAGMVSTHPQGFEFLGDASGAASFSQAGQWLRTSSKIDSWGNAYQSCVGNDLNTVTWLACFRYGEVVYDADYTQFPTTERILHRRDHSTWNQYFLTTTGAWDRGLGVLSSVTDPTGQLTRVTYDGFGRVTSVRAPNPDGSNNANAVPVQRFRYELALGGLPISRVTAWAEHGATGVGTDAIETRTYVDGLGRTRATLSQNETATGWIQSGIAILNARGNVRRA